MTRRIAVVIALLGLATHGCSLLNAPEEDGTGTVSFRLVRSQASDDGASDALALAALATDSMVVDVYPPVGNNPEVSRGFDVPMGSDTVEVKLSVVAQDNKRVAVRLFESGSLLYWGVDEDVDVAADTDTHVSIQAQTFTMGSIQVNPARLWHDEPFAVRWNRVNGATSYWVQQSTAPDFSAITWEGEVQDTAVVVSSPSGDYYLRTRAQNVYAASDWQGAQIHVGGAPLVSGISTAEVLRGETIDVDVFGVDLDHASTQVSVFGRNAVLLNVTPTQLTIRAQPLASASSDVVTVTNDFGSDQSTALVKIQSIAYLMGTVSGGNWTSAGAYEAMIEAYGALVDYGAVAVVPFDLASFISDWSVFDVIIVGADTATSWNAGGAGVDALVAAIDGSGASVMAIGRGGATYLDLAKLDIGLQDSQVNLQNTAVVVDNRAPIYTAPNDLGLSNGEQFTVHTGTFAWLVSCDQSSPPPGAAFFAQRSGVEALYPLAQQVKGNLKISFLWGFEAPPATLTPLGLALFQNAVVYLYDDAVADAVP